MSIDLDGIPLVSTACSSAKALTCQRYISRSTAHRLQFFVKYLHKVANEVDRERLEEFGVDRTCAEWMLRSGGRVRFVGHNRDWLDDYNTLPPEKGEPFFLQDMDASEAEVMFNGFLHLDGIKHLQSMKIHECRYVDDGCMFLLTRVTGSLKRLQISACNGVTDSGLNHLHGFKLLEELYLKDLDSVQEKVKIYESLKKSLPKCYISYPDAEELTANKGT